MKTLSVSALLSLVLASFVPAAELIIDPPTITPNSTPELRFETPMVGKDQVGTVEKISPLVAEPPVVGEFKWTSTRSGQFRFTEPPKLGTSYAFDLREGLKDVSGVVISTEEGLGEFTTADFTVRDHWRDYPYSYGDSAQRVARFVLQFNDEVNPSEAAAAFSFDTEVGGQRVPVTVRAATGKDFRHQYQTSVEPTWAEMAAGTKPKLKPEETRPNALVVEAKEPLPVGRGWRLLIDPGFKNRNGSAVFTPSEQLVWGSVLPLEVRSVTASTHFDSPHEIEVSFNKVLTSDSQKPEELAAQLKSFVKVEPAVENLNLTLSHTRLSITGDFALNTPYTVTVNSGLTGGDGLALTSATRETVTFNPSHAYVSTTATINSQLSSGNGVFDIYAANFKDLHLRVKQLSDGELMKARALYEETYDNWSDSVESVKKIKDTPFESFPGTPIFEKLYTNDKPLEKATLYNLKWADVLGQRKASALFIEMVAEPQAGAPAGVVVNRAIVEFTDIGLLLKHNEKDALVYAFSLKTGQPLPNVQLTIADTDRGFLRATQTDAQGLVTVPSKDAAWVLAKLGDDCTAMNFGGRESRIGLWGHGINVGWGSPWEENFETFLFSDRPVYKPGDTAHVKALARLRSGDDLKLAGKPFAANVRVVDPRGRSILTKDVTFTANGTWSDDITFPEGNVGWYSLVLDLKKDEAPAPNEDNEDSLVSASLELRVDDYKTNTFEVAVGGDQFKVEKDRIIVPLEARYYMGKALSSAKVSWNASLTEDFIAPDAYAEYYFGDADSWWNYGEERDDETASHDEDTEESWGAYGQLTVGEDGKADIEMPLPAPHKHALPQNISIYTEVTDVNQQTISSSTEFKLPGADFILGARKSSWYGTSGKPFSLDFVAITADGKPFVSPVPVEVKIERQEWNTLRTQGAGGAITTKNQSTMIEEMKTSISLTSQNGLASAGLVNFTPRAGGTYFMTATATDASGKSLLTRVPFYVLGNGGFPWAWEDGARITLQPDKTSVKPGEEVSIVVKSPLAGKALVSVERNRIHRQFLTDISPDNPVIKLKMTDEDAPNAFVSVILIRGAQDSPQADKMPEYKVGYCEIMVESEAKTLFVETTPSLETVLPGGELTVTTTVTDAQKKPVENAEVTLYAVDEGVLSLMSYLTPDPVEFFHSPVPLAISNHTTLDSLLTETLADRYRGNKGVTIGGGGDEMSAADALRKNFVATAIWSAELTTDKAGKVTSTFKVPDSLTRYRIMAIAVKDADRFGSGESAFVVNKPLMIEPVVPRFAHIGDELLVKAVVHNTTTHAGQVEVELKLDDTAKLISEQRPFALISLKNRTMTTDGRSERRVISLKAGETTALAFPVQITKRGTAAWQWRVKTTEWPDKPLADAVESKFEVTHPAPALREVRYFQLTNATTAENLLKKVNPQILESDGELRLDLNQSRMGEARDALEHLLHYPYGCVEQTTSSTLPWLALSKYEPLFPDLLQADKVTKAIKRGADRLLTMQTDEGGLAYWPGGEDAQLWASAYGGYALFKAKDWGIAVPQESLDKLTDWMSKQLRELDLANTVKTYDLCDAAFALYTLAKAGKPEAAYQNVLYTRRDKLPENSRLFLALAMCIGNAPEKQIAELIKPVAKSKLKWEDYWLGSNTASGLRLIVCAHLGLTAEANKIADELMNRRNAWGHWGTTFSNSWILLGLSTNERVSKDAVPFAVNVTYGDKSTEAALPSFLSSTSMTQAFSAKTGASDVKVTVPEGKTVRGRLEVKAYPDLKTFQPVVKGFGLKRRYERLTPLGTLEPAKDLRVGDMIVITLEIEVLKPNRYLALEDPLPSVFEPINPEFDTQNQREDAKALDNAWYCDFRELRDDKALFFTNDMSEKGKFELSYLARVIAEGDVIAPPARIEAMYEPAHHGLSDVQRVITLPMGDAGDVVGK
jgi:alpha-2-macroglobulin